MTHVCDQTCSDCATSPRCAFGVIRIRAMIEIDILEVGHVWIITTDVVLRRKEAFARGSVVAARVEYQ